MLTVFNRRELITLSSQQTFFHVREALSAAGIASKVNFHGTARAAQRARYGSAGLRQDAMYTYTIYVHRDDYDRARLAIQPALRNY